LKESQFSSQSVRELSELREEVRSLQKENRALQKQSQISMRDVQELSNLREQVNSLQMDALAKVDKAHVVPDTQVAQDFRTIVGIVKGLSRSVQLSNETEIFYILDAGYLLENVPTYRWSTRA
jgi:predicted RNase H-like nuclease (RuvC/YqgF family)